MPLASKRNGPWSSDEQQSTSWPWRRPASPSPKPPLRGNSSTWRPAFAEVVGLWDADRLTRVLENLVANAIKYSPAGSTVVVRVDREEAPDGPLAVLSIADQGVGIPAADLPHIFERFRRGGNVAGRIAGSGLGLWGSQRIVAQHGGTIAIDSTEGKGTTVTVRLPLKVGEEMPDDASPAPIEATAAPLRRLTYSSSR